jgi:type IV pilus assembly protein PilA
VSEATSGKKVSWKSWLALFAVLSVIAAVAIPQYGDYSHRAQASETISLMSGAKTSLAEYFADRKKWPTRLEEVAGNTSGKYTLAVSISKGAGGTGEIELTGTMRTEGVDRRVAGTTILMTSSDGGKNWACKPGTTDPKNLPVSCRN